MATILASPILTRLYTPADFGVLAVFSSMLGILAVIAALRYEFAIPLPRKDADAVALLKLSAGIVIIFSLVVAGGVGLLGDAISAWTHTPSLKSYLWLLPLGLLSVSGYQVLNYWTARRNQFTLLSFTRTARSFARAGFQVTGGAFDFGALGLIGGLVAGRLLGTLSLFWGIFQGEKVPPASSVRYVARRYKNFPLYNAWAALVNAIGMQAPPILFARYFSVNDAGFFSLTMQVLGLPAALIGQAVGQVFYPMAAKHVHEPGAAKAFVERIATVLLAMSFPVFAFVALSGPVLFTIVFGESWLTTGVYARYLSPWLMVAFVSSPLSMFVLAKEKQKLASLLTLYETTLRLGAVWLGTWLASPDWAVKFFSVAGIIISLINLGWVLRLSGGGMISWLGQLKGFLTVAVLLLVLLIVGTRFLPAYVAMLLNIIGLGGFAFWFVRSALQEVHHHA
ncbi:MAG: oligosaccharide flippase family protein [Chloroflexi bacterium]|nr:oligosaccharide flippase family protein [Chloroflexota bacterium]